MAHNAQQAAAAQKIMEARLMRAAQVLEDNIDDQLHKLDNMDEDDLEAIRQKRINQLKEGAQKRNEWLAAGNGVYSELSNERDFFNACKKSQCGFICHFYRDSTFRCKIVDKHLALLAPKHVECRMVKMNAEKSPFLTQRLSIIVIPTIIMIKDEVVCDRIVGFDELGGHDEFSTAMMEWRLGVGQVINYSGDLSAPPDLGKPASSSSGYDPKRRETKTIRGKAVGDNDEDSD